MNLLIMRDQPTYFRFCLLLLLVAVFLFAASSSSFAIDFYWTGSTGDWSDPANWGGIGPTESFAVTAYINNGGTAIVTQTGDGCSDLYLGNGTENSGTVNIIGGWLEEYYAYIGNYGTGTINQSAGIHRTQNYIYLGYNSGSNGTYNLSGSGQNSTNGEYVGYSGIGTVNQTGGTNQPYYGLIIGYNSGSNGNYNLSGTAQLTSQGEFVGNSGTGTLTQLGGTNTVSEKLVIGAEAGSSGTYILSGSGILSAKIETIGSDPAASALFHQTGGTNTATYLSVGSSGLYKFSSGTLQINGGMDNNGTLDFDSGPAILKASANSLINWGRFGSNLKNTKSASVTIGANSLLIVPAGFNPTKEFKSYSNAGLIHTEGTTLTLTSTQGFSGWGIINDPIICQGKISPCTGGSLELNGSVTISGSGNITLGTYGSLTTEDILSSLSGGKLSVGMHYVGKNGTGVFTQTGGTNSASSLVVGSSTGSNGTYNLSGTGLLSTYNESIGNSGTGQFFQTGGTNTLQGDLHIGGSNGTSGTYNLSGNGKLSAENEYVGFYDADSALFIQSGGQNTAQFVSVGPKGQYSLRGGTLQVNAGLELQGTLDFAGGPGVINANNTIINFGRTGSVIKNAQSATLTITGKSLLIIPSGFDPSTGFASFSNTGMVHTAGTPLVVASGQGFSGCGTIDDPIDCQGSIAFSGWNSITGGLMISGNGIIGCGYYDDLVVKTDDSNSGMSGGSLDATIQFVGYVGTGVFTQTGGSSDIRYSLSVGYNSGSTGTYNISGNAQLYGGSMHIGNSGTGTFNHSSGTVTGDVHLGSDTGSVGTYNLSGDGQLHGSSEVIGGKGTGVFNQSGGVHSFDSLNIGKYGTYNFTAGKIIASYTIGDIDYGSFNFGGGILTTDHTLLNKAAMTLTGINGDANVDTAGYAVTFSGPLSGPGGLKKLGTNTLTLTAENTYTGNTTIAAGTLVVSNTVGSGTGTGQVVVSSGGTLAGSGVISGPVSINAGGTLAPGNSPGTLTVNNQVTFQPIATFSVEAKGLTAGTGYDQLQTTGPVSLAGSLTLSFSSFTATDNNILFMINNTGSGATTGTFQFADNTKVGTFNGRDWYITYDADNAVTPSLDGGNDVAIYTVPEPGMFVLLASTLFVSLCLAIAQKPRSR